MNKTKETPEQFMGLDGQKNLIKALDDIKAAIDRDPNLRAVFRSHALNEQAGLVRPADPVAKEIASTVTERWDERKEKHPREPWIKNPVKYISHVYKRWLDAGTLKQIHLKHDPSLYRRYAEHISQNPKDDLGLPKSLAGRPGRSPAPRTQ